MTGTSPTNHKNCPLSPYATGENHLPPPLTKGGWEGFKSYFRRKWATKTFFPFQANKLKCWSKVLREILYGMTAHEMDLELRKEKGHLDHLFMLVVFGDLVGLPLLPPYYSMRLLPYIVPSIEKWKRSLLREKDLTDFVAADIG
jgi:hypothetical protein